jgi:hypothetical protein
MTVRKGLPTCVMVTAPFYWLISVNCHKLGIGAQCGHNRVKEGTDAIRRLYELSFGAHFIER